MNRQKAFVTFSLLLFILLLFLLSIPQSALANDVAQLPTVAIPTVTSTPSGPMAIVVPGSETQINLRSGPGMFYDKVGVLLVGQKVPAKGKSPGGAWILVEYPGVQGGQAWVFANYVRIDPPRELPVVEIPPTPTPQVTNTIDPTLAAKFIVTVAPTRLPTYTPPPPLNIPTFQSQGSIAPAGIPMGLIILGCAALGVFFGLISFVRSR